jgi:hypothetical protein
MLRALIHVVVFGLISCNPTVDTSDLATSCAVDDDCRVTTEPPCYAPGCLCEGVAVNQDGLDEYNRRLLSANAQCGPSYRTCTPCATDSLVRTPSCQDRNCVALPGDPNVPVVPEEP